MGATAAERQRRYRARKAAHNAGDHSLCGERSACDVTDVVTSQSREPAKPRRLGARGARLWEEEGGEGLTGIRRDVLEEACRLVDRLDRLNAIVNGRDRAWLTLEIGDDGQVEVVVDKLLSESRQQQLALKQLAGELRAGGTAKPVTGGGVLDQLAARRKARVAGTAG